MLARGTRLGAYEILASLGAGGMGEVYRAHDSRLDRDVALKVLPEAVTKDTARLERFTREARALAALNHPHIVTIFSTEEAGGLRFFTMELVKGQGLDALIPGEGLPLPRFLDVALPIADALTAAHQKGITHRDLKPGNVMMSSDGRVKVLDFGLARVENRDADRSIEATRAVLTQEGAIVGTMPYMSPEQLEGRELDPRSDLFSLGVMFYEMLAGVRPFESASAALLTSAILRDDPSELTGRRTDLPDTLVRLVSRCLEKRPEDRVQTARDVYNELRYVQRQLDPSVARRSEVVSGTEGRRVDGSSAARASADVRAAAALRVAVLPFTARSGDEESAALADGLTDDVTTGLSRFAHLRVVSRAAVERVKALSKETHAASTQLEARYLLDGAVRKAGAAVRVTVRLVDAESGANLWAEHYDRDLGTGAFAIQDDVANRVVVLVADSSGVLVRSMVAALRDRPAAASTVADLTLQYFSHIERFSPEQHSRLRADLERALEQEPHDATGWACLSNLYAQEHELGLNLRPEPIERQRRAAERAVALDATCQYGWVNLATAHYYGSHDLATFRREAERAIALNPLNTWALVYLGIMLAFSGDWERGAALVQRAMALNPHVPGSVHLVACMDQYRRGQDEAALVEAKKINMPELEIGHLALAAAAGQVSRADDARAALDAVRRLKPALLAPANARGVWGRLIHDRALVDRLVEGLEKALAMPAGAGRR